MKANEYHYLYNSHRWRKIRKAHLEAYPLCVMCEGQGHVTLASVCDHIEPHKGDEELFYNGPFQSLCKLHHDSTKQRMEHYSRELGGNDQGEPLDRRSHWYVASQ